MQQPQLVFLGKFKISITLSDVGTVFMAVNGDGGNTIVLTSEDSACTIFNAYGVFGQNSTIVLQPSNVGFQLAMNQPLFACFDLGQPDKLQEYFPSGKLGPLEIATQFQSEFSAAGGPTQFLLPSIGAHLVAKGVPPVFWVQPHGLFDEGMWNTQVVMSAAASSWDSADLRFLQLMTMFQGKSCKSTNFTSASVRGYFLQTSFAGANFTNADLSTTDWSGITINPDVAPTYHSDLTNAILVRANVSGARFDYCTMPGTDLSGATCAPGTCFAHCDLTGAKFKGTDVSGVDFTGATLTNADFTGATMRGTILTNAVLDSAKLPNIGLTTARFSSATVLKNAILSGANLNGCNLGGIDLTSANLSGAQLQKTDLTGATLFGTNISNTDVTTTIFSDPPAFSRDASKPPTSFNNTTLNLSTIKMNWSYLDLTDATLVGLTPATDLTALNATHVVFPKLQLPGATMKAANFSHAILSEATLDGAHAQKAVFDSADLTGAKLTGADLTAATLIEATLYSAILATATLTGADFTGAQLGAKETLFTLASSFAADLDTGSLSAAVRQAFATNHVTLSSAATLTVRIQGQDWLIQDSQNNANFNLAAQTQVIVVFGYKKGDSAAVLSSAYMPNAIFTDANLYACHLTNAQWYGSSAKGDNADFEAANFSGANVSATASGGMNLKQAKLFGASFSNATLVNADLSGAYLSASAENQTVSFGSANLQGTIFTQAKLDGADFTDAAISLDSGVVLFPLDGTFIPDLDQGALSDALIAAFQSNGHTLLDGSTSSVEQTGSSWIVNNGGGTPPVVGVGSAYATFTLRKTNAGGLQVYGSSLWITSIGDDGHLQTSEATFAATGLSENEMKPVNVFPNGQPYSAFPARFTWEQMMTAKSLPAPPSCVPSPTHWCTAPSSMLRRTIGVFGDVQFSQRQSEEK